MIALAAEGGKPKTRYPAVLALRVAKEVCDALKAVTARLIVAGSLRRRRPEVSDVEVLYIPLPPVRRQVPGDMFAQADVLEADESILDMERRGILERRLSVTGATAFGPKNKLMRHVASGVPVDLFATSEDCWWNYLVCRTGPGELNRRIAILAHEKGLKWNPYGVGFTDLRTGKILPMTSETDVFRAVGLPYREPWERR